MDTPAHKTSTGSRLLVLSGYTLGIITIMLGWSLRDERILVSSEGAGYWLGVIGASMMVLLLGYPLRKRLKALHGLGRVQSWFRVHMMFGVAGPILILFHSNFSSDSLNASVALISTLIVASSGILGRYFYSRLHNGLYGQRVTYAELREALTRQMDTRPLNPEVRALIDNTLLNAESQVLASPDRLVSAFSTAARIVIDLHHLRKHLHRELSDSGLQKQEIRHVFSFISPRLQLLRKFAQLRAFERLFSLWHVIHYPLFIVLVVTAAIHVLAVHLY